MELDHCILFVSGAPSAGPTIAEAIAESVFPGWVLDSGRRHVGQGTRNRRVILERNYVELLWVEDPEEESRTGLGFAARCGPGARCPFGVVVRGVVPAADRDLFVPYQVPGGGPALLLLAAALADPDMPLVAAGETADRGVRTPAPRHPSGARDIRRATYRSRAVPDLGTSSLRDVVFESGEPGLRLEVDGLAAPWRVSGPDLRPASG